MANKALATRQKMRIRVEPSQQTVAPRRAAAPPAAPTPAAAAAAATAKRSISATTGAPPLHPLLARIAARTKPGKET